MSIVINTEKAVIATALPATSPAGGGFRVLSGDTVNSFIQGT